MCSVSTRMSIISEQKLNERWTFCSKTHPPLAMHSVIILRAWNSWPWPIDTDFNTLDGLINVMKWESRNRANQLTNVFVFRECCNLWCWIGTDRQDTHEWSSRLWFAPCCVQIENQHFAVLWSQRLWNQKWKWCLLKTGKDQTMRILSVSALPSTYFLACEIVRSGLHERINNNFRKLSNVVLYEQGISSASGFSDSYHVFQSFSFPSIWQRDYELQRFRLRRRIGTNLFQHIGECNQFTDFN